MRRYSLLIGILFIACAIGLSLFVHAAWLSQPEAGEPITLVVAPNDTKGRVRDALLEAKLIGFGFGYDVYGMIDASVRQPKAGTYVFRKGTSYQKIARTLFIGPLREEVSIQLIEGKTINEEAAVLQSSGVTAEEFAAVAGASLDAKPFDHALVADYPFLADAPKGASLEGYLFPNTYRVWKDELPEALVRKQLSEFASDVVKPYEDARKKSGMSWHEVVTLASIVEDEVRTDDDRKMVAGIFLNRLKNGMRIQSDATVNYVTLSGRARSTDEDLAIDSPYNTYRYDGLPPGPIGNPSLSALRAVLEPTVTANHYFLTDEQGKVYYAKTFDEHIANRRRAFGN